MKLSETDVLKIPCETIAQFRERHGITYSAIKYAADKDKIDVLELGGKIVLIVTTEKTKNYFPNKSVRREIKRAIEHFNPE